MRDGANLPRHARVTSFAVFLHRSNSIYDDSGEVGQVIFVRAGTHAELFSEQGMDRPSPAATLQFTSARISWWTLPPVLISS